MGASKGAVALSNLDTIKLLQQWGFEITKKGNGGHVVLTRGGKRLQVTAPGRATKNTYRIFKKAADMCDVSITELIDGPPKGNNDIHGNSGDN